MSYGRQFLYAAGAVSLSLAAAGARADGIWDPAGDWSCACLTYDGGTENCHMFASAQDGVFSFGAFETSGEGTYSVEQSKEEAVVIGQIRTGTGQDMTVFIVQPMAGGPAQVFIDERLPGGETFTAACAND